jgi:uncharacterized protein involved in cysteine biosynthesis
MKLINILVILLVILLLFLYIVIVGLITIFMYCLAEKIIEKVTGVNITESLNELLNDLGHLIKGGRE